MCSRAAQGLAAERLLLFLLLLLLLLLLRHGCRHLSASTLRRKRSGA
jgi:hypothetical protein